jgi:MFS transporter, DHA1 family, multidrug resistance protein
MSIQAPRRELSEAAKQRGLYTILADTFLMWAGFFMVIPLLSIHYVEKLGWAAASVGFVLAVRQFTQQGLTPISGMLADKVGAKGLICAGLLLRTVGFATMAWADTFPLLLASTILAALGGSMFDSPKSAAIAALTDERNRPRFYSLNGVVSGLGLTIGTQIGALLLPVGFSLVAWGAAICFLATFLVTLIFLPPVKVATEGSTLTEGFRLALHDRPFVIYNLLLMGYWFMWVQLSISVPLGSQTVGGGPTTVSWIYGVNSIMTIVLQYPLIKIVSKWLAPLPVLIAGIALMGVGLGTIALAGSVAGLLLCVVVFSAGSLLATPSQQTVTADLANPAWLGSYFGVNSLSLAIGGGLGNLSGGLLYDVGKQIAFPSLPWVVFLAVGLFTSLSLGLMMRRRKQAAAQETLVQAADF